MAFYKYLVKNEHGESIRGKIEAKNKPSAAAVLSGRGLLVIKLSEVGEGSFSSLKNILNQVKEDDVVNMTRQLATMITAGLPLSTSLSILAEQSREEVAVLVGNILKDIEGGSTFSESLAKKPDIFSRVYIQLIRAGETGGVLENVLNRLAETLEKNKEFKGKIKGAMIYPIIVVIAMLIVGVVMLIFVIPQLTVMYEDFGAELPFVTQLLVDASNALATRWWVLVILFTGAGFGLKQWKKTKNGAKKYDAFMLKLPVFGELKQKIVLTEFARTFSLLLGAGVSLINSLSIVAESIESVNYRDELAQAVSKIEKGVPLSQSMNNSDLFPPILQQMVKVGEETGKLDEVLLKLSLYFQTESEQQVKNLTTALEPMIMIVLGVGVGVMVVAIIMPIYSLTNQF